MEAAKGSGLLTLHLLRPQHPAARAGQSAVRLHLEEVPVTEEIFFFFFADEPKPKNHSGMDGEGQLATDAERVPSAPWTAPRLGKAKEGQRQDSSSPLLVPAGSGETSVTPLAATSKHCLCL